MVGLEIFLAALIGAFACVGVGHVLERLCGGARRGSGPAIFNLACFVPASLLHSLISPLMAGATVLIVNAAGGGAFALPSRGWGLVAGVLAYLFVSDLFEYLFHRLQHKIPVLWSMHAFHHSDRSFNVSTTIRHFWVEGVIKAFTIYLLIGCLFRVPAEIVGAYTIISYYNYVLHLDVRWGFGRWSWLLNSPQYHRLHHSRLAGDENCNFAAILSIFDVLAGAYRQPRFDEYPPTGLDDDAEPSGLLEAMVWPVRAALARRPT